jgi:hypothetical protein
MMVRAKDIMPGDVYVTRGRGLVIRRRVLSVLVDPIDGRIELRCEDFTTPVLPPDKAVTVERPS